MLDASLAQVAAELYAGAPDQFVANRNARAAEAADRGLATQIRALKKPSVAAWVMNVFARERAEELSQALELAGELREAQAVLDAPALAELGRQRRALTSRLAQEAVALASGQGGRVSTSTAEAVRQTITAAFFDPEAATAVASGRLVRELEPSGAFPLDAIAGGDGERSATITPIGQGSAISERRRAEAAVREAERDLQAAQRDRARVELDATDLARRLEELARREGELQTELARVREGLEVARDRVAEVDDRKAAAEASVVAAEDALATARRALP